MPSTTNQPEQTDGRRKWFVRQPPEKRVELTTRDLSMLNAIQSYGGVLPTILIWMLFWPPSLLKRLCWWGMSNPEAEQLLASYPAGRIDEEIQVGKWLLKLQKQKPHRFTAFDPALTAIGRDPKAWLLMAIAENPEPPEAFHSRPRYPNQYVSSACIRRLRLLYDDGWLDKDEPATKLHQGRGQTLWYLSRKARNYLAQMRGVRSAEITWKPVGSFGDQHLPHRLALNEFRVSVTLAAERLGFELKKWWDEDDLRKVHSKQKLALLSDPNDPDSKTVERWLSPDSYCWLDTGSNWFHFVEIDKGTETLRYADPSLDLQYWELKVRKYGEYFKQYFKTTYPEADGRGRILVITTSETRLTNMAQVCREVAGEAAGRYWLTTFDRIAPTYDNYFSETVLTGAIWQRADKLDELRTLVW